MGYATTDDLAKRWRLLSTDEEQVAQTLLDDASAILDDLGYSESSETLLKIVACNMVRRAMERHGNAFAPGGVEDGSYGWEATLPAGELYPFDREVKMLSRGKGVSFIKMADLRNE